MSTSLPSTPFVRHVVRNIRYDPDNIPTYFVWWSIRELVKNKRYFLFKDYKSNKILYGTSYGYHLFDKKYVDQKCIGITKDKIMAIVDLSGKEVNTIWLEQEETKKEEENPSSITNELRHWLYG